MSGEPADVEPASPSAAEEGPRAEATATTSASVAVEPDSAMGPPEQLQEDEPGEKAPLKTVSSAADGPEDGGGPVAKADGAAAAGDQERPQGAVSLWLAKPRVMWWIAVLVAILLLAVVLVATFLSTGKEAEELIWTGEPGLITIWPRPRGRHRLIRFRHGSLPHEGRDWPALTGQLSRLVSGYDPVRAQRNSNVTECFGRRPDRGRVCLFDVRAVAPECTSTLDFGYKEGSPCIFLQFANLSGWEPGTFGHRDINQLLPEELRPLLKPGLVLLHCEGDTIVDRENLGGIAYTPEQGFRTEFFPYSGHRDYMAPLVAVQFRKPTVGVVVGVRCRLWAPNVPVNITAEMFFNLLVE